MPEITIEQAIATANQHRDAGRFYEADAVCQFVLSVQPDHPDALHTRGLVAAQCGDNDRAVSLIERAIALVPDNALFHCNLGSARRQQGRYDDAMACCRRALELDPRLVDAHFNLGVLWKLTGHLDKAVAAYQQALALNPGFIQAMNNLGVVLTAMGRVDEAILCYRHLMALRPDFPDALNNLGNALRQRGQLDEPIACYRKALAINPAHAEAMTNLGNALRQFGRDDEAITWYRRAVALRPNHPDLHNNLAHALLSMGEFAEGWAEYQWRWKSAGFEPRRSFPGMEWDGAVHSARTVLLVAEQGYGDMIQFIRYAPMVAQRCDRVLLECPESTLKLFASAPGIAQLISRGQPLPAFDAHCTLLSLPRLFGTRLESIPAPIPYIKADSADIAAWSDRLGSDPRRKVGLAWAGSPQHTNDRQRSISPATLAPLLAIKNGAFHSLQKGPDSANGRSVPPQLDIVDHAADLTDFARTAALIANLDLVISVDTAVAHLAGAMGKPVWLLLPFASDWRWLRDRTDSPWYPTMRIFRQPAIGDWTAVIHTVLELLNSARA
jgi:tetratricopeptide (TPR) repeat protein